jgi:hypothetical protein
MKAKFQKLMSWPHKIAVCLAFFAILTGQDAKALGLPPLISVPPLGVTVQSGGTATMTATIGLSLTPLEITWRLNGTNIANAKVSNITVPILGTTLSTLTISNVSAANAGNYSVHVENGGGEINSGNGLLIVLPLDTVLQPVLGLLAGGCGMTNGGFRLQLVKPANSNCVIEATSDFKTWTPICTNSVASTNVSYLDYAATNMTLRYYRARLQ